MELKTLLITWSDGTQTTIGVRKYRFIPTEQKVIAQFPDWEWEEMEAIIKVEEY